MVFIHKRILVTRQSNGLLSLCQTFIRVLSKHNCLLRCPVQVWYRTEFLKTYNNLTRSTPICTILEYFHWCTDFKFWWPMSASACPPVKYIIDIDCHIGFHHIANDWRCMNVGLSQFQIWDFCCHLNWKVNYRAVTNIT